MMMYFIGMDFHIKNLDKVLTFLKSYDFIEYQRIERDFAEAGYTLSDLSWPKIVDLMNNDLYIDVTAEEVIDRVFSILHKKTDGCVENPYSGRFSKRIGFYHRLVKRQDDSVDSWDDPLPFDREEIEKNLEEILSEITSTRGEYRKVFFDTVFN